MVGLQDQGALEKLDYLFFSDVSTPGWVSLENMASYSYSWRGFVVSLFVLCAIDWRFTSVVYIPLLSHLSRTL